MLTLHSYVCYTFTHISAKQVVSTTVQGEEEVTIEDSTLVIEPFTRAKPGAVFIKTYPKTPSIMSIVNELEQLFDKFNEKFFESSLSKPVITLSNEGRRSVYGWFTVQKVWMDDKEVRHHEINICPEHLNRPIEEVCETLLHEMIHMKNAMAGVKDCHRNGLYHTKKFQVCAEQHGLNVVKTEKYGWAETSLKDATLEFIKTLKLEAFELFRNLNFPSDDTADGDRDEGEEKPKTSSSRKYVCSACELSIRATKEVRVRCEDCNVLMQELE